MIAMVRSTSMHEGVFIHESACVDEPCEIGEGTEDLALLPRA